jgi:uncharacterized membrane protein YfcA
VTWEFTVTGLLVGALVGMTGMGGGSLMTPILVILFGFKPTYAIGTDILHGAIFKSFGAWRHRRLGTVNGQLVLWMILGSAPMSLLGVEVSGWIGDIDSVQSRVLGGALVAGGVGFFVKAFVRARSPTRELAFTSGRERLLAIGIGLGGGFVVGLTSVGSGTFFGLAMLLAFPLLTAAIVGTDIFHAALLLWVAGISHLLHGNVDLHATAWLLIGSIPGVLVGSQFTVRLPDRVLRVALATVLALSGIKLLDVPESTWILVGVLAGGSVVLSALGARGLYARRPRGEPVPVPVQRS